MKKDKEWAKCIVRKELKTWQNIEGGIDEDGIKYILDIIDQLGEPKVTEVPVVPEEVYEYITQKKRDRYTIQQVFYQVHWNYKNESMAEEEEWVSGNEEEFAKAWLAYPNIEEEKEPLYYVLDKNEVPLLIKLVSNSYVRRANTYYTIKETNDSKFYQLTEQEIKDYDERFWAFAVPVVEVSND